MNITYVRKLAPLLALALCASFGGSVPTAEASPALTAAKACRKTISLQGRSYAKKRLGLLLSCVDSCSSARCCSKSTR